MAVHVVGKTVPVEEKLRQEMIFANSLTGFAEQLNSQGFIFPGLGGPEISSANTLWDNNRWYLISNFRQLLSQIYAEHGIVQTLVDQPVDDAFRAGFEIKSGELDADDIERIMTYCERHGVIHNIMQAIKWGRLYGGGAILVLTNQNPARKLNIDAITPDDPLEFRSADMWELFFTTLNTCASVEVGGALGANMGEYFDYYGEQVHESHVFRVIGKEAPSFIRPRLRGWGMSELERLVRSLNQYLKNQDLIFQLLDEAKVDVFGIKGMNNALLNAEGTNQLLRRVQLANRTKSFNAALIMDSTDTYEQKQITFAGLAEVLLQIRQGIAADLKMPMTKVFGISAAGFNSGDDDIENYNSMIEGEIRNKNKNLVIDCIQIICQKLFGFRPADLMITFNPLRILNAKEEEEVKDSQYARVQSAFTIGLATAQEAKKSINRDSLLGVEVDETTDALPPLAMGGEEGGATIEKVKPASGDEKRNSVFHEEDHPRDEKGRFAEVERYYNKHLKDVGTRTKEHSDYVKEKRKTIMEGKYKAEDKLSKVKISEVVRISKELGIKTPDKIPLDVNELSDLRKRLAVSIAEKSFEDYRHDFSVAGQDIEGKRTAAVRVLKEFGAVDDGASEGSSYLKLPNGKRVRISDHDVVRERSRADYHISTLGSDDDIIKSISRII